MGIDIRSGSPRSRQAPTYSVVVLSKGGVIYEREGITFHDLVQLVRKYKADVLALDNIYEIARDYDDLENVISQFPPKMRIIQVTGSPGSMRSLKSLAKEAGIQAKKWDPITSARVVAELAYRGYGSEIVAMFPETRVLITKNRSIRQGGSGSDRWRRSIEASILSETNRIATELDKANMDYDLYIERASGGLRRAEFIVYSDEDDVRKIVKETTDWSPIRIIIKGNWRKKIKFVSGEPVPAPRARPLIVGIDPGMSVGLAILDLKGRLLALKTLRKASRSQIVEEILEYGYPIIVATDVNPPPKSVIKIASLFDAKVYVAKYSMKAEEKKKIVDKFEDDTGIRVRSSHERDSLAAALKVYYSRVKNLISKADAKVNELNIQVDTYELYEKILRGVSISQAIDDILSQRIKEEDKIEEETQQPRVERLKPLLIRISQLKMEIARLKAKLREKDLEIKKLREKIDILEDLRFRELERDRRISQKNQRIRVLEEELTKLRWSLNLVRSQIAQLTRSKEIKVEGMELELLPSLTKENVERVRGSNPVLVLDASGTSPNLVKRLKEMGVPAVFYRGSPPPSEVVKASFELGVPFISANKLRIIWSGIKPLIPTEDALRAIAEARIKEAKITLNLTDLIMDYRRRLARHLIEG